jgi:predicted nucleotidyltransferase
MSNLKTQTDIELFIKEIICWAKDQLGLLAVALVGSYARGTAGKGSDIDLVLIALNPGDYLKDTTWAGVFGEIEKQQIEPYGKLTSLRVRHAAGPKVEFGLTTREWASLPLDFGTQNVISDGVKVLFEREAGILSGLI